MLVNVNELIKAVKQFPELYDSSHVDYYKHSLKEQKWMLIAKKFNLDIDKPKELWQRLRLIYRQALKNQERRRRNNNSTLNERQIKPWVYQEQMAFLQPFLKIRSKETEMDILMLSDNEEEGEEEKGGGGRGRQTGTQDREEDASNNPWEIPVVLVDKLPSTDTTAMSLAHSCINLKIPYNFETQEPIMDAPEVKGNEEVSIDNLEIKIEPQEIEDVEEVSIDDLEIKVEHQEIEDVKDIEFGGEVVKIQGSQFVNPQFEIDIEVPEVSFSDNTFSSIPNTNQARYLEDDDDDDDEEMAIHGEGMSSHEEEFMDDGMQPQLDSRKKMNQKNRSRKKAKYRKLSKYDALKELVNRGQFSSGLVGSVNYSKGMVDIVRQKVIDSISNEIETVTKEKEIDGSDSMASEDDISSRGLSELEKTQKQILEGENENWVQEGENQKPVPKAENQRTVSVTKNQNWVPEDKNQKPEIKNVKNNGCKKGGIQRQKVRVDSASTVGESGLSKFSNIKKSVEQTSVNASSVKNSVRENLESELLQYEMVHEPSCDSNTFTIVSDSDETNGENVHTNLVPIQESVVDVSSTVSNNDLAEGLLEFVTIPEKPVVEVVGNVTKKGKRRDKVQKCRVSRSRITKAYTPNPKKSKYEALKQQIFNGNQELILKKTIL